MSTIPAATIHAPDVLQRERPEDGDLVITAADDEPQRFVLAQLPREPQMIWTSREAVVRTARQFARRQGLDVWSLDGTNWTRIDSYRPRAT
jgi:hypothetical protein